MQVSAAYYHHQNQFIYDDNSYYFSETRTKHRHTFAVPVLARYAVARHPERRLQPAIMGGIALVWNHQYIDGTVHDIFQQTERNFHIDEKPTIAAFAMAGPSLCYRLGRQWDVTGDLLGTFRLKQLAGDGFSASLQVGVRYRFG